MKEIETFYRHLVKKVIIIGQQLYSCCPFHDDHNPSFSVNLETGQCRCFSEECGFKGNVLLIARALLIDVSTELRTRLINIGDNG